MWTPIPHLAIIPAFRLENRRSTATAWTDTGAASIDRNAASSRDMLIFQQLEVRHTGVTNSSSTPAATGSRAWQSLRAQIEALQHRRDRPRHRLRPDLPEAPPAPIGTRSSASTSISSTTTRCARTVRPRREFVCQPLRVYPGFIERHDFTTDDFRVTWRRWTS
jgi:hypothetical protein